MRLAAVNAAAAALGLKVGVGLADARAIIPDLLVRHHDPHDDADFLDWLADGCARYSPMVAVEPPDGLVLDITGAAHLWQGEAALEAELVRQLKEKGLALRSARASSAEAAHALARYASGPVEDEMAAILALPVEALELGAEPSLALRRAGLKTIECVAKRQHSAIAARFGPAATFMLERLIGQSAKPLHTRSPICPLAFQRRFADPIASKVYALSVLQDLLGEAQARMAQEDLGGRAFVAQFNRVDGQAFTIAIETGLPTRDPATIARLFDERLDVLADPLDPGFGFDSIHLSIPHTGPLKQQQDDIESPPATGDDTAELLDRMAIRLGRSRVLRFRPRGTHIPESTQVAVPALDKGPALSWPVPEAEEPPCRPLQLFDPPYRITVVAEIPDGPPRRFRWRDKTRDVRSYEGPERIAAEWWRSARDPIGRDQLSRDYYRIEDSDGRRYWVFRHGLYGRETHDPGWYLHGLFA